MSVTASGSLDALNWQARAALRLYPQSWRDAYESEVVGTLLDVAEATNSEKVPVREIAPLAVRGLWLRARTSPTFWGGLLIVGMMLFFAATQPNGLLVERYWTTILATSGSGVVIVLPIVAVLAALRSRRTRRVESVRARELDFLMGGAAILAFVVVGYVAAIVAETVVSGLPPTGNADVRIPVAYVAMTMAAIALGFALGFLLPAPIATAVGFVAAAAWFSTLGGNGDVIGWRDITGSSLAGCCSTLSDAPQNATFLATSAVAFVALLVAAVVIAVSVRAWRPVPLVVAVAAAALALFLAAPAVARNDVVNAGAFRDPAALVCDGTAPRICLWPEQEAMAGPHVRALLTSAYGKAVSLGIPAPSTITSPLSWVTGNDRGAPFTSTYWPLSSMDDQILTNYAQGLTASVGCPLTTTTAGGFSSQLGVDYAIAHSLGASDQAALPRLAHSADARLPDVAFSPSATKEILGVVTPSEIDAVISAWNQHTQACSGR